MLGNVQQIRLRPLGNSRQLWSILSFMIYWFTIKKHTICTLNMGISFSGTPKSRNIAEFHRDSPWNHPAIQIWPSRPNWRLRSAYEVNPAETKKCITWRNQGNPMYIYIYYIIYIYCIYYIYMMSLISDYYTLYCWLLIGTSGLLA